MPEATRASRLISMRRDCSAAGRSADSVTGGATGGAIGGGSAAPAWRNCSSRWAACSIRLVIVALPCSSGNKRQDHHTGNKDEDQSACRCRKFFQFGSATQGGAVLRHHRDHTQ